MDHSHHGGGMDMPHDHGDMPDAVHLGYHELVHHLPRLARDRHHIADPVPTGCHGTDRRVRSEQSSSPCPCKDDADADAHIDPDPARTVSSRVWTLLGNAQAAEERRGRTVKAALYGVQVFYSFFIIPLSNSRRRPEMHSRNVGNEEIDHRRKQLAATWACMMTRPKSTRTDFPMANKTNTKPFNLQ
nr:hypothetical protein CFP56_50353 [Quercus suber]